jgi:hypothetical protein
MGGKSSGPEDFHEGRMQVRDAAQDLDVVSLVSAVWASHRGGSCSMVSIQGSCSTELKADSKGVPLQMLDGRTSTSPEPLG